jgi:uncharacterized membrane protein YeaQ/YmgE (transglycosylase-associated protein family)
MVPIVGQSSPPTTADFAVKIDTRLPCQDPLSGGEIRIAGVDPAVRFLERSRTVIGWAIAGLIIGAMARLLFPGKQHMGLLMTMILGILGSAVGGVLTLLLFGGPGYAYHPAGWIMSILGAILLLWICDSPSTRRSTR